MGRRAAVVRLRVDGRRPASWLALVAAAAAAWWIADAPDGRWPAAALVAGAVVAAAAVGAPPREPPGGVVAWAAMRSLWPAAGAVAAWLVRAADPATAGVPATLVAAAAGTAAVIGAATRGGLSPADAAGQSLACGVVAAACAAGAATREWAAPLWPLAACVGWAATVVACGLVRRGWFARDPAPRGALLRVAMTTSLVGMVVFLFLAPHLAWAYAALGVAWLLVAAAPRGALGAGFAPAVAGWQAAGAAARPAATYAAVLVWPPLVAAILAGSGAASLEPLAVAAAIGFVAAVVAGAAATASGLGWSRDTSLAVVLCAALAACAIGSAAAPRRNPPPVSPTGLMLSNPGDPARLPGPRRSPRVHM